MFLNDPLQHFGSRRMIPDTVRINHRDGPLLANPQAVRLRAVNAILALHQAALGEAFLQVIPGRIGYLVRRAFGFGLIRAEENMAREMADPAACRDLS